MTSRLERLALQRRLRIGPQRRAILKVLEQAREALTAEEIYRRARTTAQNISLSTVQRTLGRLTAAGVLRRLKSSGRKWYYEKNYEGPRESMIDAQTGQRIQFHSEGIEGLLKHAMQQLGYRLLDYRLELYGRRGHTHEESTREPTPAEDPKTAAELTAERGSAAVSPDKNRRRRVRH